MADTKYPTLRPELIAGDLRIELWQDHFAKYIGTRAQLEAEGDAVEDCVEQEDIVSDLLCEDDPVYEFVSMAEIDGLEDIDGAELTVG